MRTDALLCACALSLATLPLSEAYGAEKGRRSAPREILVPPEDGRDAEDADRAEQNRRRDASHETAGGTPALPLGETLDSTLERAESTPASYPAVIHDDKVLGFWLFDRLEYRLGARETSHAFAWEGTGWLGGDFNRLVVKLEGEATLLSGVESELDILYSRLIAPFWSLQGGMQYSGGFEGGAYDDLWAFALAIQGLAPGKFEVDASLYLSEKADVTGSVEVEYDLRVTQRLVLQPRTELSYSFMKIPERGIGPGPTSVETGVRLRYEFVREFAPYVGLSFLAHLFGTASALEAAGEPTWQLFGIAGFRLGLL